MEGQTLPADSSAFPGACVPRVASVLWAAPASCSPPCVRGCSFSPVSWISWHGLFILLCRGGLTSLRLNTGCTRPSIPGGLRLTDKGHLKSVFTHLAPLVPGSAGVSCGDHAFIPWPRTYCASWGGRCGEICWTGLRSPAHRAGDAGRHPSPRRIHQPEQEVSAGVLPGLPPARTPPRPAAPLFPRLQECPGRPQMTSE